jgi:hypothetical protein
MNEFIVHWQQVDSTLAAAGPLTVNVAGVSKACADLTAARTQLLGMQSQVQGALNEVQITRAQIAQTRAKLLAGLNAFNAKVVAYYGATWFLEARPKAPSVSDGLDKFLTPMRDVMTLWLKINAAPAPAGVKLPLTVQPEAEENAPLPPEMTQADFTALVDALDAAYLALASAEQEVKRTRSGRDGLQDAAYAMMKAYRQAAVSELKGFPTLLETLPHLTPDATGHTPEEVNASAVFVPPDQARITYEASTDADVDHYDLLAVPGDEFSAEDAPREFVTGFGLTQPGAKAAFAVSVVLTTGNQNTGPGMVVERPV